jgi:uncharacterized protein (TIGR01777 family)
MNILITGGTGLVGQHLSRFLVEKGYDITILSRSARQSDNPKISYATWSPDAGTIDAEAIRSADHIIHLAGENVAEKRWTKKRKQDIHESRTKSSALIINGLKENRHKVKSVISASAIGWYGPDRDFKTAAPFSETASAYKDFLGGTCKLWEESIQPVKQYANRLVILRTGIVLTKEGGALKEFIKPLNSGIATILGSGKQVISWIHIDDLCRMYLYAIENNIDGVYNAVSPQPVTNKELVVQLAAFKRGKMFIPVHVPAFVLKIMLGEMSIEVLKSATVSADKIKNAGFHFRYPGIRSAFEQLFTN